MSNPNMKQIVNKTIYTSGDMFLKIDGVIDKKISGPVGQYVVYDTAFFVKIFDKKSGTNQPINLAKLAPHKALSMATHILDIVVGVETSNFEEIISADQRGSIRAGVFESGFGIQITHGAIRALVPLTKNDMRGFAELLRVTVQTCEHFAAVARSKYEVRRKKEIAEAANVSRDSQAT